MADIEILEVIEANKKFFKRYRKNRAKIERLENKKKIKYDRMLTVRSPNLSGMPRGGTPVTIQDLQADISEIEDRIERLNTQGRKIKAELVAIIDEIEDTRYADVLELWSIECMSITEIAEELGYTERHIYTLYSEALASISISTVLVQ